MTSCGLQNKAFLIKFIKTCAILLSLVFRALLNIKVPLKLSDVQTQENRAGMG